MIQWPSARDWLFSFKTFAAAMLALYIALAVGLPRPYWAMAAVYIVSHPLTGATRSKALYRVLGTLLGASAAVFLVPLLVNAPLLLSAAVALWTGSLLYISLLHRTPRSYVFMLAAYTLPLIALPAVSNPASVFDLAVARSEEILLGIVCASVVAAVVFPGKIAPVLNARTREWLGDAAAWATDVLAPADPNKKVGTRHRLASDILALDQLISQLSYDPDTHETIRYARELRGRMTMLLPVLSSLTEVIGTLRARGKTPPPDLARLMGEIADWMRATPADPAPTAARLRTQLRQDEAPAGEKLDWDGALVANARNRLAALVELWQDCLTLQQLIAGRAAAQPWQPVYTRRQVPQGGRHYDHGMMLFATLSASLATFVCSAIWIGTGWNDGAGAVTLAAVSTCFFASTDEPAPFVRSFFVWTAICIVLAAIGLFALLPLAHDFETLVMLLAPPFLLVGTLFAQPRLNMIAMLLTVNTATFLGIQGVYNVDFTAFVNGNVAGVAGALFALVWVLVTRPFGTELALRRLVRACWRDLADTAAGRQAHDYGRLRARMLDQLGQLVPRLATNGDDSLFDGFAEVRVGFSALELQRDRARLPQTAHAAVRQVLDQLAAHYQARLDDRTHRHAPDSLKQPLDEAIRRTAARSDAVAHDTLNALVELRVSLFPGTSGLSQQTPPPPAHG